MNDKQKVAQAAIEYVKDGMVVGLGTGSTANYFIEALALCVKEKQWSIKVVSSSTVSLIKAQEYGLELVSLDQLSHLDLYVDGADEVTPDLTLLKGRGYDLVKEKLLAKACKRFLVLVDQSKQVETIGEKFPVPIEVIPFAWQMVKESLRQIGGDSELRQTASKDGLVITSHGSLVLDTRFKGSPGTKELNDRLNAIPGVVEHGVFYKLASDLLIVEEGKVSVLSEAESRR
ncbi:ribose-5-phosphate isomerase RpiA [Methylicorpusculum oleiharenae]|uniref:ribose-5-phosphate isomerase RpiA n=1 Tax=Methylicorpusculum oleiharenae TaxID=1338687 RepID=UPI00135A6D3C|nr:ribose-5-phosphate isomerase RpiA [Methylicorpusculum oleiharenae]MCD2451325.1 ribose-5-phosphate isomerase RpiA [Methylicorpusculum oleiharenae]